MLLRPKHGVQGGRGGLVSNKEKLAKIWKIFGGLNFVLPPLIVRHTDVAAGGRLWVNVQGYIATEYFIGPYPGRLRKL